MSVGPLTLAEHVFWFLVLSLGVFLVYNTLRAPSIRVAARVGLRRWLAFVAGAGILAVVSHFIEESL